MAKKIQKLLQCLYILGIDITFEKYLLKTHNCMIEGYHETILMCNIIMIIGSGSSAVIVMANGDLIRTGYNLKAISLLFPGNHFGRISKGTIINYHHCLIPSPEFILVVIGLLKTSLIIPRRGVANYNKTIKPFKVGFGLVRPHIKKIIRRLP